MRNVFLMSALALTMGFGAQAAQPTEFPSTEAWYQLKVAPDYSFGDLRDNSVLGYYPTQEWTIIAKTAVSGSTKTTATNEWVCPAAPFEETSTDAIKDGQLWRIEANEDGTKYCLINKAFPDGAISNVNFLNETGNNDSRWGYVTDRTATPAEVEWFTLSNIGNSTNGNPVSNLAFVNTIVAGNTVLQLAGPAKNYQFMRLSGTNDPGAKFEFIYKADYEAETATEPVEKTWVKMDRSGWTVFGCSEYNHQGGSDDGGFADIFDDNMSTFWHTDWSQDKVTTGHFFIVDFGKEETIGGIGYQARLSANGNGFVQNAAVYVVNDITGVTHSDNAQYAAAHSSLASFLEGKTPAWEGDLKSPHQAIAFECKAMFDKEATGRYLIFQIINTDGDGTSWNKQNLHANCAEFYAYVEGEGEGGEEPEGPQFDGNYAGITDWTSLGTGKFCDGFLPWADSRGYSFVNGKTPWEAEIQEATDYPGIFRVVNPYANCPTVMNNNLLDTEKDYYMWVDARVPESCVIPTFCTGVKVNKTGTNMPAWAYAGGGVWNKDEMTIRWTGAWSGGVNHGEVDADGNPTSFESCIDANCNLMVGFPGAPDYTFDFDANDPCSKTAEFSATLGEDITGLQASWTKLGAELDYKDVELNEDGKLIYELTEDGAYYLSVKFIGKDGNEKGEAHFAWYNFQENADQWKTIGNGRITEGFAAGFFGSNYGPYTYDVPVQENVNTPGFYRLVDPMSHNADFPYFSDCAEDVHHYIFIHAENPEEVTMDQSALGLDGGYGEFSVKAFGTGTLEEGIIKFPYSTLAFNVRGYNNQKYYYASGDFSLVLPVEHTVSVASANETYGTVAIEGNEDTTISTSAPSVTVVATPAEGVTFIAWIDEEGKTVSTEATYTIEGTSDVKLTAVFGFMVNTTAGEGGSLELTTDATRYNIGKDNYYAAETVFAVKAEAAAGYTLKSFTLNGEAFTAETYTLTANAEFAAEFAINVHTLTLAVEGKGEVKVGTELDEEYGAIIVDGCELKHGDSVNYGTIITFVLQPAKTGDKAEEITAIALEGLEDSTFELADLADYMYASEAPGCEHHTVVGPFKVTGDVKASVTFTDSASISEVLFNNSDAVEIYNVKGVPVPAENLSTGVYVIRQGNQTRTILIRK